MTPRTTRAQRLAMPLARDVVRELAVTHGGCVRPVQLRRTDTTTGQVEHVLVPCGHTLAHVCPSCAERARTLRAAQCREGWHLEHEPDFEPDPGAGGWVCGDVFAAGAAVVGAVAEHQVHLRGLIEPEGDLVGEQVADVEDLFTWVLQRGDHAMPGRTALRR